VANSVLGRDYTGAGTAHAASCGLTPAPDRNGDGYLTMRVCGPHARQGARFVHEPLASRTYGQMRSAPTVERRDADGVISTNDCWRSIPSVGIFMDNSDGKPPVKPGEAVGKSATTQRTTDWR
jgi:hypothetical protein